MATNKLQRFQEVAEFDHVMELTDFRDHQSDKPKGRWRSDIFGNNHPITLELGCGKSAYTLALGRRFPHHNFVGIDIKGARIWKGAKQAREEKLDNVHFLRIYIDHLDEYFAPGEVDDIWITFPDPYPKPGDRNKRLNSPKFLKIYQKVLKTDACIHLKTDSDHLFSYSRQLVQETGSRILDLVEDIYTDRPGDELLTIKTNYEKKHLKKGKTISYISFRLPDTGL